MAAGDSGQDPGEMVIAGVPPVLVRWGKVGFRNCSLNVADAGEGDGHARWEDLLSWRRQSLVWLDTSFYVVLFLSPTSSSRWWSPLCWLAGTWGTEAQI